MIFLIIFYKEKFLIIKFVKFINNRSNVGLGMRNFNSRIPGRQANWI